MLVSIITNEFFNDMGTNGITIEVFVQFTEPLALGRRYIRDGKRKIQDDVFFYPEPKSPQCVFADLLAQKACLSVTEISGLQDTMRYLISTVLNGIFS